MTINKINPHKTKYHDFYKDLTKRTAQESVADKKVGAIIVLPTGLIAVGWNGMPAGFNNTCEWVSVSGNDFETTKTKAEVVHAERNALDKLTRQGVSSEGAIMFSTMSPCMECAKSIASVGIKELYYDQTYKTLDGINHLKACGVHVATFNE